MAYPRQINLSEPIKEALRRYLDSELENHRGERGAFLADIESVHRDYWAKPSQKSRSFPFQGASNIIIPLQAMAVETVFARDMMTAFSIDQTVSVQTVKSYAEIDRDIERYLDHVMNKEVNFRKVLSNADLERIKLGTCVCRPTYKREVREAIRTDEDGNDTVIQVTTQNGAVIDTVPVQRFLMPFAYQDPQTATWVGEEMEASPDMVLVYENSGLFRRGSYDALKAFYTTVTTNDMGGQSVERKIDNLANMTPTFPQKLYWHRILLTFQVHQHYNEDGIVPDPHKPVQPREIEVYYHKDSGTFLSIRYNWYDDLHRDYRIANYQPIENRWAGIGIGKMVEQFQREITTQHRQRLDNGTLANCRMFAVNKLTGIGTNEPIFPGKIWLVDNKDDVVPLQMGELYTSSFNNESQTLQYVQMRHGVNELTMGMPQAGTPGTAAGEVGRLQESNKKHDYYYSNLRIFAGQLITDTVCNISQFGFKDTRYFDYIENGAQLREFLTLPSDLLRSGIVAEFNLVSQNQNKLIDRQNWTQLTGILQQYYMGMLQMAQTLGDQNLMAAISNKFMVGATEAAKQILESFDVRDPNKILLTEILNSVNNPNANQSPAMVGPGQNLGSSEVGSPNGMGTALQIVR